MKRYFVINVVETRHHDIPVMIDTDDTDIEGRLALSEEVLDQYMGYHVEDWEIEDVDEVERSYHDHEADFCRADLWERDEEELAEQEGDRHHG